MAITTKNRNDLKSSFVNNAIPTEQNFADLIDAQLNQSDDGVFKLAGEPLSVVASGGQKRVLRLYADYPAANADWLISLNPAQNPADPATNRAGFGIADGAGNTRLFLDASGKLGLGTNEPQGNLDVRLPNGTGTWNRFVVNLTNGWGDAGAQFVTIGAGGAMGIMVNNPHIPWYAVDGRASIRYGRTGGTANNTWWDVGLRADGSFGFLANDNGGNGQQVVISKAGLLTASAGLRFDGSIAHLEMDGALYRNVDGQVYLTVDDNFYFRNRDTGTGWAVHVNTATGTLNAKGGLNALGALTAANARFTANGGLLDVVGTDHGYIQFYPQKLGGGRKGWFGYGSPNGLNMGLVNDSGELYIGATGNISINASGGNKVIVTGGLAVNDGTNSGVNRGVWLWGVNDPNHVIYSANPSGKTPANTTPTSSPLNANHRMRFRTPAGQGFMFENTFEQAVFDVETTAGNVWMRGAMYVGGSDIYFTQTDHTHTGIGNTVGHAAIENASDYGALMILGRSTAQGRIVKMYDYVEVSGTMRVTGATLQIGDWTLESSGNNLFIRRGSSIVARFSVGYDRFNVFQNLDGRGPYCYYNTGGAFSTYGGTNYPP